MKRPISQVERMKYKSRFYKRYERKCMKDGKQRKSMEAKEDKNILDEHIKEVKEEMWNW